MSWTAEDPRLGELNELLSVLDQFGIEEYVSALNYLAWCHTLGMKCIEREPQIRYENYCLVSGM